MALIFPMSKGVSISLLKQMGVFERELAYVSSLATELKYPLILLDNGYSSSVFRTFRVDGGRFIAISLGSRWKVLSLLRLITAFIYLAKLEHKVVRVNQLTGAPLGLLVSLTLRCQFILRMGYSPHITHKTGLSAIIRRLFFDLFLFLSIKKASLVLVTTQKIKTFIEEKGYILESKKIHIVPNYVPDYFLLHGSKQKENKRTSFVFVGRLSSEKRILELISSFKTIQSSLTILGDGPLKGAVLDMSGPVENVNYMGKLKNEDIPALVSKSDFIILPSYYEGHPKVISEAAAVGVPSVLSYEVANLFPEASSFSLVLPKNPDKWSSFLAGINANQAEPLVAPCLHFAQSLNKVNIIRREAKIIWENC